jgi:predicted N-acyltransferase
MNHAENEQPARQQRTRGTAGELRIVAVNAIDEVDGVAWDACAVPPPDCAPAADRTAPLLDQETLFNPFLSHHFLSALESSKSVGGRSGWQVQHVLVKAADGTVLAAAPCYLKSHSRGEYVFDAGWAEAYMRAGGSYYPKLQVAVPFTPATGRRLLVRPGPHAGEARRALVAGLIELCGIDGASGVHVTFATEPEFRLLGELGFLQRTDQQFHWENSGYGSFDDFLAALAARKRKTIRRERHEALANGISVHWLTGSDLTEDVWDTFFAFYMDTGSRKWGRPYLTRPFFSLVGETMRDRILLVMAKRSGRWIAGRHQFHRLAHFVRPPLGRRRASSVPALRAVLLSGDRLRDRPQALPRRGRCPGRTQAGPRLYAHHHLFGPLHRRPGVAARGRRLPGARARLYRRSRHRACRRRALSQGFHSRGGLITIAGLLIAHDLAEHRYPFSGIMHRGGEHDAEL